MKGHAEVEQVLDGRRSEKQVRPVLTRGQWRATLKRERERGNDAQCRGAIEVCSLNPESAFAFGPWRFSSVCVFGCGGGVTFRASLFIAARYTLSLSPDALPKAKAI